MINKQGQQQRRQRRVRAKARGIADRPRLCVFRSNNHIYVQLIGSDNASVLASSNDLEVDKKSALFLQKKGVEKKENIKSNNSLLAYAVGKLIAQKSLAKKIEEVTFDRGAYKYHGVIKALAEGARDGGLKF